MKGYTRQSHRVTQKPAVQLDKADSKRRENSLAVVHHRGKQQRDFNNPTSHKPPMEEQGFAVPLLGCLSPEGKG